MPSGPVPTAETTVECASRAEWDAWLAAHHGSAREVWLRLAKKNSGRVTITRADALEVALAYGWIDGKALTQDEHYWLQRFTPRGRRSRWSKINCDLVERLSAAGAMKPAGLAAVAAAKADGRWDAAYAPPSSAEVPEDFRARLRGNTAAAAAFEKLSASARFTVIYHLHDAKKPETRARRIEKYIGMLERGEPIR